VGRTVYRASAGHPLCRLSLAVSEDDVREVEAEEISAAGSRVLLADLPIKQHDYLDAKLELEGSAELSLFANVVDVAAGQIKLRWLHLDNDEEERLAAALDRSLDGKKGIAKAEEAADTYAPASGTTTHRRKKGMVKPRGEVKPLAARPERKGAVKPRKGMVTPRAEGGGTDVTHREPPPTSGEGTATQRKRTYTSRVVKPVTIPGADSPDSVPDSPEAIREVVESTRRKSEGESSRQVVRPTVPTARSGDGEGQSRRVTRPSGDPAADAASADVDNPALSRRRQAVEPSAPPPESKKPAAPKEKKRDTDTFTPDDAPASAQKQNRPTSTDVRRTTRGMSRDEQSMRREIIRRGKVTEAKDLANKEGKVLVLNLGTIRQLIGEAVNEAVGDLEFVGGDAQALMAEVEKRVAERMKSSDAEKKDLEAQARGLEKQLEAARKAMEAERQRDLDASQFTVSEAGLEDLDKRFERLLQRAIKNNGVNDHLADELQKMVAHVLDAERERIAEKATEDQQSKMSLLEKKINRLAKSLQDTEQERDLNAKRLKFMEAQGTGVANIMDAGLAMEDPDYERKKLLMKEIFDRNREMRREYKEIFGEPPPSREKPPAPPEAAAEEVEQPATEEVAPAAEVAGEFPEADDTPAPETSVAEAQAGDSDTGEEDSEPAMDPDDLPWEGPSEEFLEQRAEEADRDVKVINDYKDFAPPPLERDS